MVFDRCVHAQACAYLHSRSREQVLAHIHSKIFGLIPLVSCRYYGRRSDVLLKMMEKEFNDFRPERITTR